MFIKENEVFVVAEIGKNFIQTQEDRSISEYLENAKKMIQSARSAGANAVKFQTHIVEDEQLNVKIKSPHFPNEDRCSWIKRVSDATPKSFWFEIKKFCEKEGITFFSTPMSRCAAILLDEISIPIWKIGSGDILDFVMLDFIRSTKKTIILSTGMSTIEEIDLAVNFLREKNQDIILLHCVSKYPCPVEDLNLNTIKFLRERYNLPVGFSDHSLNWESAVAAVNLGAVVIEKHFTLNRNLFGPDHKVSITPDEFKTMTKNVRKKTRVNVNYLGNSEKILQEGESVFRDVFRKTLVAGCDIDSGAVLRPEMIYAMRPKNYKNGLPSEKYESVVGKRLTVNLKKYDPIKLEYLQNA